MHERNRVMSLSNEIVMLHSVALDPVGSVDACDASNDWQW